MPQHHVREAASQSPSRPTWLSALQIAVIFMVAVEVAAVEIAAMFYCFMMQLWAQMRLRATWL
jgi:hypothetical protein